MRSKWVPKGDAPSDFSGSRSVLLRNYTLDENNNDRVDDDGDVWSQMQRTSADLSDERTLVLKQHGERDFQAKQ
ncbi:hypothetical protein B296_00050116 [Ensete ventricosum]|uniref:Uncharacterized protein n=1 Tax=Ensete ventricosum TaxID=4639 RepID=A0A426XGS4_ENSVE|nr:hypothetical protein B296_00050116 [Ensete ventricosum]